MMVLTKNAAQNDVIFRWLFPVLIAIAVLFVGLTLYQPSHSFIRENIVSQPRKILGKTEADFSGRGDFMAVIKVQTPEGLFLEIYKTDKDHSSSTFLKRIALPDSRDGYFTFRGNATNLALVDITGDAVLDIVAPTFDENLVPRLNVYKFDPDTKDFIKTGAE